MRKTRTSVARRTADSWRVFAGINDRAKTDEGVLAAATLYLVLAVIEDNPDTFPAAAQPTGGKLATLAGHCRSLGEDGFFSREVFDEEVVRRLTGLGVEERLARAIAQDVPTPALAEASRLFDLEPGALAQDSKLHREASYRAREWARARTKLFGFSYPAGLARLVARLASARTGEKNAPLRVCLVAHPHPALAAALEAEGDFQLFCPQESAAQALGTLVAWCFEREHPAVELRLCLDDPTEGAGYDLVLADLRSYEQTERALGRDEWESFDAPGEALLGTCAELMGPGATALAVSSVRALQSGDAEVRRGLLKENLVDAVVELRDVENRLSMGDVTLWALRRGRGADDEVLLAQAAGDGLADLERRCDGSLYDELEGNGRRCGTALALADAIAAGEALPLLSTRVSVGDVLATDGADLRYTTYASSVDLAGRIELLAASYDDLRARLEREYAELRATLERA